jgi:hypothetical protein
MEGKWHATGFAGTRPSGLPWAPADGRCCGRPLGISEVEPAPPGYWENESARLRCVLKCAVCGKQYLGWYD